MEISKASNLSSQPSTSLILWPALLGLFFFAFTFRSSSGAYLVGMIILLVWLARTNRPAIPALPSALIRVCKIYLGLLCIHMLWTLFLNEYDLVETLEGYRHYAELLLFIPFSVVMYHCRKYWLQLLWVPALAVVVRVLHRTDFNSLDTTLFYKWIYGFGQHHVTFGMQAMLAIIIIAALGKVSVQSFHATSKRVIALITVSCAAALLLQALITSGSRSAWGCLLIGLLVLVYCNRKVASGISVGRKLGFTALLLVVTASLVVQNIDKLERRLGHDTQGTISLSIEDLPRDQDVFFARRVHLAYFGWQYWQERPLIGHGPASVPELLAADPDFHVHPHLHNTYVQVLMELGAIVSTSLTAVLIVFLTLLWRSRPAAKHAYRPIYNLIAASSISLAIWSVAGFHLHSSDWRFVFTWYAAFAAFLLRHNQKPVSNGPVSNNQQHNG